MYHFDLVSNFFFQRFHFFCNTPVLFSMIFVARFRFSPRIFFSGYIYFHFSIIVFFQLFSCVVSSRCFSNIFFRSCFLVFSFSRIVFLFLHNSKMFLSIMFFPVLVFQCLFFKGCSLPFFPAHDYKFFPICFFRCDIFFPGLYFLRLVFSRMLFPELHFSIFFVHLALISFSRMFFPELHFADFSCALC